jgi:hypothetical protein
MRVPLIAREALASIIPLRSLTCSNGKVSVFRTQVALSFEYEG